MTLIIIALIVAALYSGGAYLYAAYLRYRIRHMDGVDGIIDALAEWSFHLGLCFILTLGFLGLIIK